VAVVPAMMWVSSSTRVPERGPGQGAHHVTGGRPKVPAIGIKTAWSRDAVEVAHGCAQSEVHDARCAYALLEAVPCVPGERWWVVRRARSVGQGGGR